MNKQNGKSLWTHTHASFLREIYLPYIRWQLYGRRHGVVLLGRSYTQNAAIYKQKKVKKEERRKGGREQVHFPY